MKFLQENWGLITLLLVVLINVLNAATAHFSNQESKVRKVLLFIAEVLSVFKSSDVSGFLKLPLTSAKPEGSK